MSNDDTKSLSQSLVNRSIESSIKSQFHSQRSIENSPFYTLNHLSDDQVLIIKSNDNMKKKIDQILKRLHTQDEIILISQAQNIQKMLSILEIIKQKITNKENIILNGQEIQLKYDKYVQYNKLDSVKSKYNPNYKPVQRSASQDTDLKPLRDEDSFTEAHLKELGISQDKIYKIPILYIYLKCCRTITKDDTYINQGWSFQST